MTTHNDNTTRPAGSGGDELRSIARNQGDGTIVKTQVMSLVGADGELISSTNPMRVRNRVATANLDEILWYARRGAEGLARPPAGAAQSVPAASSAVAFDPTKLQLSAYWRASYPGSAPWPATPSSGVSAATGDLVTNLSDPTAGGAVNGYTPALFDDLLSNNLVNSTDVNTGGVWTTTGFTIFAVMNVASTHAATGNVFDDAVLIRDGNSDVGLSVTDDGLGTHHVSVYAFDGAYHSAAVPFSLSGWDAYCARFNGSTLGIRANSLLNNEVTTACGTLTVLTGAISVGVGYPNPSSKYFDGSVLEIGCMPSYMTDDQWNSYGLYVQSRYGLSLGF